MRVLCAIAGMAFLWAAADAAWAYQPAVNFQVNCMGCHRADGSGQAGRVPSLRHSLVLFSASREGRDYIVRVPGVAQSPLSDADTAALLNWMARNLSDLKLPPDFVDYSAAEVRSLRHRPLAKVSDMRVRLMQNAAEKSRQP
jgi:mono/diheme cytochrome c family protein